MFFGEIFDRISLIVVIVVAYYLWRRRHPQVREELRLREEPVRKGLKEGKESGTTKAADASDTKAPETDK